MRMKAVVVTTGEVLRFDESRGYGFIAPDDGGEDVFVHANDLHGEKYLFRPGTRVSFEIEDGDRGLKASGVSVVESAPSRSAGYSAPEPAHRPATQHEGDELCDVLSPDEFRRELTETLIEASPSLTAAQIVQIRRGAHSLAVAHGWIIN